MSAFHVNGAIFRLGIGGCGSWNKLFPQMIMRRNVNCCGSKDLDPTLDYRSAFPEKHQDSEDIDTARRLRCH
jgi:hypothetical protein